MLQVAVCGVCGMVSGCVWSTTALFGYPLGQEIKVCPTPADSPTLFGQAALEMVLRDYPLGPGCDQQVLSCINRCACIPAWQ